MMEVNLSDLGIDDSSEYDKMMDAMKVAHAKKNCAMDLFLEESKSILKNRDSLPECPEI